MGHEGEGGGGGGDGGALIIMHGRSRKTVDPRIPTMPGGRVGDWVVGLLLRSSGTKSPRGEKKGVQVLFFLVTKRRFFSRNGSATVGLAPFQ